MMPLDEYNALVADLIGGLPASLVIVRLNLALLDVVQAGGADARATLRNHVTARRRRDEGDDDAPPPPPPPPSKRR